MQHGARAADDELTFGLERVLDGVDVLVRQFSGED